jgi:ApaG protein
VRAARRLLCGAARLLPQNAPMPRPELSCSVVTRFLPDQSSAQEDIYAFAYTITIRNTGEVTAQVIGRHWVITHGSGDVEEVRGLGVVGQQPLLKPGEQFEYTSWTRITTPRGNMRGELFCMTDEAEPFEATIEAFPLAIAQALH